MSAEDLKNEIISLINSGWTQGANARNAEGLPVPARNPDAVEWDIMGAIIKATEGFTDFTSYHEVLRELTANIPEDYKSRDLEAYNDDAELSDILDLLGYAPAVSFAPHMYEGAMTGIQIDEYVPVVDLEGVQIYNGSVASADDLEVGKPVDIEGADFQEGASGDLDDVEVPEPEPEPEPDPEP